VPKWIGAVLAVAMVLTNAAWAYVYLDLAVTLSYREGMLYEFSNQARALSHLSTAMIRGKDKMEVRSLLQQLDPAAEPFEKDGALTVGWISVDFGSGEQAQGIVSGELWDSWATPR
jgi:hypothetical protein